MPKLKLTAPDGTVKTISVSQVPNEEQMARIKEKLFTQQPQMVESELPMTEQRRDDIEEANRDFSFGRVLESAKSEISGLVGLLPGQAPKYAALLMNADQEFETKPIKASKNVNKATKFLPRTKEVIKEVGTGMLNSIGFDPDRPGDVKDKFDFDVFLNRFQDAPLSTIGDLMIVGKGISLASKAGRAGLAGMSGNKVALHKAIKRSGDDIQDAMRKARDKARERGAADSPLTPGEEVALNAKAIKGMEVRDLNSAQFPKKESVKLAEHLFSIGKRESRKMDDALKKVANNDVPTKRLSSSIKDSLVKENFANTIDDAIETAVEGAKTAGGEVNVITPLNKQKLNKFLEQVSSGDSIKIKELKNILDVIDDSINWTTPRASDRGLKIMRSEIRKELGGISKEYDQIATRIHDRLTEMGYVEKKIRRAQKEGYLRKYKEDVGLEIARSSERTDAFQKAMEIVGDESAAAALGRFDNIKGWAAWNDLYGTNQKIIGSLRGDVKGGLAEGASKFVRQQFRSRYPQVDIPSQLRKGAGAVKQAASPVVGAAKTAAKALPVAATLSEPFVD